MTYSDKHGFTWNLLNDYSHSVLWSPVKSETKQDHKFHEMATSMATKNENKVFPQLATPRRHFVTLKKMQKFFRPFCNAAIAIINVRMYPWLQTFC